MTQSEQSGTPRGNIDCTENITASVFRSCSMTVMTDATPLTPLAHEQNFIFNCRQHTIHDPRETENNYTIL